MTQPTVTVEAAFGDTMFTASPTWVDVSAYVRRGRTHRGRPSVDGRFETGTAELVLDNRDGRFTPDNASGAYYPDVVVGTPVRITAEWDSVSYPVFYGSVRSWPPQFPTGNVDATVTIPLVDGFYDFNLEDLAGESYVLQRTDQRIAAVLDDIGWPAGLRDIDAGVATVQATSFAFPNDGGEQPALAHLLDVAESEVGVLFMGRDGKVVFQNRVSQAGASSQATYDGSDYSEIGLSYNEDYLWNVIRIAREDGAQVEYDASAGKPRRVLTRDVMPMGNDAEALNVAEWLAAMFGTQRVRVTGLRFKPLKDTQLMTDMLAFDLRTLVTVQLDPPGGDSINQASAIESVTHEWVPQDWTTTWTLTPLATVESQAYWILGTSELGVSTRLA